MLEVFHALQENPNDSFNLINKPQHAQDDVNVLKWMKYLHGTINLNFLVGFACIISNMQFAISQPRHQMI